MYTLHLHTFKPCMSASRSMKTSHDYRDFATAKWTISSCVGWSSWQFAFGVLWIVLSAWLPAHLKVTSALTLTGWDWMRSLLLIVLHFYSVHFVTAAWDVWGIRSKADHWFTAHGRVVCCQRRAWPNWRRYEGVGGDWCWTPRVCKNVPIAHAHVVWWKMGLHCLICEHETLAWFTH